MPYGIEIMIWSQEIVEEMDTDNSNSDEDVCPEHVVKKFKTSSDDIGKGITK